MSKKPRCELCREETLELRPIMHKQFVEPINICNECFVTENERGKFDVQSDMEYFEYGDFA